MKTEPFSKAALQSQVDRALQEVKPHHGHAKLRITLDGEVVLMSAVRFNDKWMLQGKLSYDIPERLLEGEIEVLASW